MPDFHAYSFRITPLCCSLCLLLYVCFFFVLASFPNAPLRLLLYDCFKVLSLVLLGDALSVVLPLLCFFGRAPSAALAPPTVLLLALLVLLLLDC